MSHDPVADFISTLKNASAVNQRLVLVPHSNLKQAIAEKLVASGFLKRVEVKSKLSKRQLEVEIAYGAKNEPVIMGVARVSKPSRRVYQAARDARVFRQGYGEVIVSTSQGILTLNEAKKLNIGGEILFKIW